MDTMKLPEWANWIVRDNDGQLLVYEETPQRGKWGPWWDRAGKISKLDSDLYPEVTWEDEKPTYLGPALELDEPEKAVIPQFVAEWIEECRRRGLGLSQVLDYGNLDIMPSEMKEYIRYNFAKLGCGHDQQELVAKAWLYGYEVEKEKLYHVVSPDNLTMLYKINGVEVKSSHGYLLSQVTQFGFEHKSFYQFTEKEIKDYDERFWPFVVEVAE